MTTIAPFHRVARLAAALAAAAIVAAPLAAPLGAQDTTAADSARRLENARLESAAAERFFAEATPIAVTIVANLGRLRGDKEDDAPWRSATLRWDEGDGRQAELPARLRTRGLWRLRNCHFPPLRLDLPRGAARETRFAGLDRPKIVTHCRDDDRGDEYLLRELQLYRIHRLLTPLSHRARLLRVTWVDSASGRPATTRWAILLEEPEALARRLGGHIVDSQGATADDLDPATTTIAGLFQYLAGNSDWSVSALHNMELVATANARLHPVPYDFDFSGMVEAFYATPPPQLPIRSVRERIFRGYCVPDEEFARAFALFQERRPAIEALYADEIGRLLDRRSTARALEYLDEFYRTIGDPRRARREIVEACRTRPGD